MKWACRVLYILVLYWASSGNAYAYLDPGTGSILFQGLVAALATGLATARFWWHRVTSLFGSKRSQDSQDELSEISEEERNRGD